MRNAKTLACLVVLVCTVPFTAQAGLNVYPADGPVPTLHVEPPKPVEYQVQKGDTVAVIAKKFSVDAKTLMAANGMSDARKLQAGKTLKIPGTTAPATAKPAQAGAPAGTASAASAQTPKPLAAAGPAATASASATPAAMTPPPPPPVKEIVPDAKGRKAGKEAVDPGAAEEMPVKGKKGKKGKNEPAPVQAPTIEVDAKTRASFGKIGVITNATDVPQNIRDEFYRYAIKWLDDLETLGVGTFANKKIRQAGSQWEATYRVVIRDSLGAEVKKVNYEAEDTPYVGHITYVQRVFTAVGPTKQAALAGPYTSKDEAIREIFSYSGKKKAWR